MMMIICRSVTSTSRSMGLLRKLFVALGLSQSAIPPMSKLQRYDDRHQHVHDHYHEGHDDQGGQYCIQGDDLKPNTWCQKMPRKICAPDNCNMVQVDNTPIEISASWIRTLTLQYLNLCFFSGSRVVSWQDDGVNDPKARGALRASTPAPLQAYHQAGPPPHNQGGLLL